MTIRNSNAKEFLEDLGLTRPSDTIILTASQLLRLIQDEREECAKIADGDFSLKSSYQKQASAAIRNRWHVK